MEESASYKCLLKSLCCDSKEKKSNQYTTRMRQAAAAGKDRENKEAVDL